ncbi:MAG: tRNA pseudouridine(55) synthase TruB [Candidatus Sumerlaeia bacterium]|nr:tRNA pseudouridine(55) synthase TruB [Candidatus Sumerlaeia bacterium]
MSKKNKRESRYNGLLVVDKEQNMTSQDVVNVVRRVANTRRIGHTGTLDPLATGLMILLIGEATKLSEYLIIRDKVYEGAMLLGRRSNTYDVDGEVEILSESPNVTLPQLQELAAKATGNILQTPPPYSAVKIDGKKLYEYARAGETVEAEARPVRVDEFSILSLEGNRATFRIACSSGTYVRTLVHELGIAAGCGALVSELRRTRIEDFTLEESITLAELKTKSLEELEEYILPMMDALTAWPIFYLGEEGKNWILKGQAIPERLAQMDTESTAPKLNDLLYLCPLGGDALAIGQLVAAPPSNPPAALKTLVGRWIQPIKLLVSTSTD